MTDREKLTEVIYSMDICSWGWAGKIADHLIANGVTFATDNNVGNKWIPVSVWLPESGLPKGSKVKQIKVLTALISDKGVRTVRSQMRYKDTWATGYQEIWRWKCSGSEITHWMPLPEPPKEE